MKKEDTGWAVPDCIWLLYFYGLVYNAVAAPPLISLTGVETKA
jgi:hypothetical protein